MTRTDHPSGRLYTIAILHLPDGYYQHKYFVTFENHTTRWCGEPCAKYVGGEYENAALVVGGNDTGVIPHAGRLPFRDLVMYEMMIDDFTAGYRGGKAQFDAVREKIDYLVELG